jgi:hypothetical protein
LLGLVSAAAPGNAPQRGGEVSVVEIAGDPIYSPAGCRRDRRNMFPTVRVICGGRRIAQPAFEAAIWAQLLSRRSRSDSVRST